MNCIPFSDSDRFKKRYDVNLRASRINESALKDLCFEEKYNRNHTAFFEAILEAGQVNANILSRYVYA